MKDINIVVVNYKMKKHIDACFSSLFKELGAIDLDIQVTVVDNASGDGIDEFLKEKFPQVKCIMRDENAGMGSAQNIGIKAVKAKYYFALNPDTEFFADQHTIQRLYDFMENNPKVGMIGPRIQYPDGSLQYSCWRFPTFLQPLYSRSSLGQKGKGREKADHYFMKDFDHNQTRPVDALMGSAMFVRSKALQEVGGFDDRFWMYFEDIDWCRRMWEAGWPVYYVHDIVLTHIHGRGSAQVPGIINALLKNKLARAHLISWLKYFWKWRGTAKYYSTSK